MALDGSQMVGISDKKSPLSLRLAMTNPMYVIEYGYLVPRPGELPARANILLAFDAWTWAALWTALASVTLAELVVSIMGHNTVVS